MLSGKEYVIRKIIDKTELNNSIFTDGIYENVIKGMYDEYIAYFRKEFEKLVGKDMSNRQQYNDNVIIINRITVMTESEWKKRIERAEVKE